MYIYIYISTEKLQRVEVNFHYPFLNDAMSTSHDKATHTIKRPTHSKSRKQCKYSILYLHCLRDFE
jgi:hypothetical protein